MTDASIARRSTPSTEETELLEHEMTLSIWGRDRQHVFNAARRLLAARGEEFYPFEFDTRYGYWIAYFFTKSDVSASMAWDWSPPERIDLEQHAVEDTAQTAA